MVAAADHSTRSFDSEVPSSRSEGRHLAVSIGTGLGKGGTWHHDGGNGLVTGRAWGRGRSRVGRGIGKGSQQACARCKQGRLALGPGSGLGLGLGKEGTQQAGRLNRAVWVRVRIRARDKGRERGEEAPGSYARPLGSELGLALGSRVSTQVGGGGEARCRYHAEGRPSEDTSLASSTIQPVAPPPLPAAFSPRAFSCEDFGGGCVIRGA
eukprot:6192377-Pleurochrysis_carterae.AAC.1